MRTCKYKHRLSLESVFTATPFCALSLAFSTTASMVATQRSFPQGENDRFTQIGRPIRAVLVGVNLQCKSVNWIACFTFLKISLDLLLKILFGFEVCKEDL
jgi:hypothetical protein